MANFRVQLLIINYNNNSDTKKNIKLWEQWSDIYWTHTSKVSPPDAIFHTFSEYNIFYNYLRHGFEMFIFMQDFCKFPSQLATPKTINIPDSSVGHHKRMFVEFKHLTVSNFNKTCIKLTKLSPIHNFSSYLCTHNDIFTFIK